MPPQLKRVATLPSEVLMSALEYSYTRDSVAMCLRRCVVFNDNSVENVKLSSERIILKSGRYLLKS